MMCARTALLALLMTVGAVSAVQAADAPSQRVLDAEARAAMAGSIGNTTICYAVGLFECHVWFRPDFTLLQFSYDTRSPGRTQDGGNNFAGLTMIEGVWWIEARPGGYRLCRHVGQGPVRCASQPRRKVGDTWDMSHTSGAFAGVTEHFGLVAGER